MYFPMNNHFNSLKINRVFSRVVTRLSVQVWSFSLNDFYPNENGTQFTSQFWKSFKKVVGTKVNLSSTFHTQIDGQAIQKIQMLEDTLGVCVIYFKEIWMPICLIEFANNNSYQLSISMAQFDYLYSMRCRSLIVQFEVGEKERR